MPIKKRKPVVENVTVADNANQKNIGENMKKRKVITPADLANHEDTKQAIENSETVASKKETKKAPVKLTKKQKTEQMKLDMATMAGENANESIQLVKKYSNFFQLAEVNELVNIIQSLNQDDENPSITLKNGLTLPLVSDEDSDLNEFLKLMIATLRPGSPMINLVRYCDSNEVPENVALFTYMLTESVGMGRTMPNTEWGDVIAADDVEFDIESEFKYSKAYEAIEAFVENPEGQASEFKSLMYLISPELTEAFMPLFNRDSFKKLGMMFSSPVEGEEAVFNYVFNQQVAYFIYDLFGVIEPDEEDEEDEETEEEEGKSLTEEPTQKPQVDAGEDEEDYEDSEEEDSEEDYEDDEEYEDDTEDDTEEESPWDEDEESEY